MARRPRHLSAEERQLWERVARTTTPNPDRTRQEAPIEDAPVAGKTVPAVKDAGLRFEPFRVGEKAKTAVSSALIDPSNLHMDAKTFRKMKRGKLKPEARIDLHGMTQAAAHTALTHFLLSAHADGRRLVLVITGKGKEKPDLGPIPDRVGVLRHQVPKWLGLPPLKQRVLQVTEAHSSHGGSGAYYVYLSRSR